jgi:hypothetical protein
MAGVNAVAQTVQITTGTSLITLIQILAATNQRVKVKEISISFNGISNTAAPILVEILRQTSAGTMSALSPVKQNSSDSETLQTTAQYNATAEPSASSIVMTEQVHPQGGYLWQAPFGGEIVVPGAGRLGLRVTAGASVSAVARMVFEE